MKYLSSLARENIKSLLTEKKDHAEITCDDVLDDDVSIFDRMYWRR